MASVARRGTRSSPSLRELAEQAFSRASGAPLIRGNALTILLDADENFPRWLDAIAKAERWIHFENYIWKDDVVGRRFVAALSEAAQRGVTVRATWDWLGSRGTGKKFWRPLIESGGEVRTINPLKLEDPFGWVRRDHRKMIAVDGHIGFVSGLCVSSEWLGDSEKGLDPWRDTGVEIRGPAVEQMERAFRNVWNSFGDPLPDEEVLPADQIPEKGHVNLRVVANAPDTAGMFRLDHLIAALARERLWLTDAYFVGNPVYVQALIAAAADGVDVRLLLPGASDLPLVKTFTRSGYRALLHGGLRLFEWNGRMLHAKSAVADDRWARIGSTNLNLASWIGNWEMDVAIEDEQCAKQMEQIYLQDLANATEIVLERRRVRPVQRVQERRKRPGPGSSRAGVGAVRVLSTIGAAFSRPRLLKMPEWRFIGAVGLMFIAVSILGVLWPWLFAVPLALAGLWVGIGLLAKSLKLRWPEKKSPG